MNSIRESVLQLAQAYRYMTHLKCLKLNCTKLESNHCKTLFDGFIEAVSSRDVGLSLEELDLFRCELGESEEELIRALQYMPHMAKLRLKSIFAWDKREIILYKSKNIAEVTS